MSAPTPAPTPCNAVVMFVDVVESMPMIAQGEWAAVQRIKGLLDRCVEQAVLPHGGRVIERRGDGLLLCFERARAALVCATSLHALCEEDGHTEAGTLSRPLQLRAGLHQGEVLDDGKALYGMTVSLAARIATMAQPGHTVLSAAVRDDLNAELDGPFLDMGPCWLKHVEATIHLFRLMPSSDELPDAVERAVCHRLRLKPTLVILPTLHAKAAGTEHAVGLEQVVADQLTRAFSRSPMLHVISGLSARSLQGRVLDLAAIYSRFRADYLLHTELDAPDVQDADGAVVRLKAALWRQGAAEPVWETHAAGRATDLLSPDSELLGQVVAAVGQRILSVEQRLGQFATVLPNLASHTLYLSAVDLLHRLFRPTFERSRELLLALHERAPRHAEPLAWLARWHVFRAVQGWSSDSRQDGNIALDYSERALERDARSALALTMAGSAHAGVRRDALTAQSLYDKALQCDPNNSLAWLMSGVAQGYLNKGQPALAASETALGLAPVDPIRPFYDSLSATASLRAGELDRCVALAGRAIRACAYHGSAYRSKAIAEMLLGRQEDAEGTVRALLGVEPHFTVQMFLARVAEQDARREEFGQLLHTAGMPLH